MPDDDEMTFQPVSRPAAPGPDRAEPEPESPEEPEVDAGLEAARPEPLPEVGSAAGGASPDDSDPSPAASEAAGPADSPETRVDSGPAAEPVSWSEPAAEAAPVVAGPAAAHAEKGGPVPLRPARPRRRRPEPEISPETPPETPPESAAKPDLQERMRQLVEEVEVQEQASAPKVRKAPATKAPAKRAAATKAAATKAGATKAGATKAGATKAGAKKAPAKKATVAQEPAVAQKASARKTPAKSAPAKSAPAKSAPAKSAPAKSVAKKAPTKAATKAPKKKAAATGLTGEPAAVRPPGTLPQALDIVPGMKEVSATDRPPAERRRGIRVLVVLSVLLLAAAAGLAAAAAVFSGTTTWRSTAEVRLSAPEAPSSDPAQALRAAQDKYSGDVAASTSTVADALGVPLSDVRGDLAGKAKGTDKIVVTAEAASAAQAHALAATGASALASSLTADQASLQQGDRVGAVAETASRAEKVSPSSSRAALLGGIVALGVLVLSALLLLRPRRSDQH